MKRKALHQHLVADRDAGQPDLSAAAFATLPLCPDKSLFSSKKAAKMFEDQVVQHEQESESEGLVFSPLRSFSTCAPRSRHEFSTDRQDALPYDAYWFVRW